MQELHPGDVRILCETKMSAVFPEPDQRADLHRHADSVDSVCLLVQVETKLQVEEQSLHVCLLLYFSD